MALFRFVTLFRFSYGGEQNQREVCPFDAESSTIKVLHQHFNVVAQNEFLELECVTLL